MPLYRYRDIPHTGMADHLKASPSPSPEIDVVRQHRKPIPQIELFPACAESQFLFILTFRALDLNDDPHALISLTERLKCRRAGPCPALHPRWQNSQEALRSPAFAMMARPRNLLFSSRERISTSPVPCPETIMEKGFFSLAGNAVS